MSNYTIENLVPLTVSSIPAGTLAIKIGDEVFAAGNVTIGGSGQDTSDATITADKILSGEIGYGKDGRVVGTIPTIQAVQDGDTITVPVGFIATEQTFQVGSNGYDTSSVTATAGTMLAGVIAIGTEGETITGTIPTVEIVNDGATITVPAGYNPTEQTFQVGGSGTDVSDGTVTAETMLEGIVGYGAAGRVVGTIQTVTAYKSGSTVIVPKGYIAVEQTFSTEGGETVDGYSELDVFDFMLILNQR